MKCIVVVCTVWGLAELQWVVTPWLMVCYYSMSDKGLNARRHTITLDSSMPWLHVVEGAAIPPLDGIIWLAGYMGDFQ